MLGVKSGIETLLLIVTRRIRQLARVPVDVLAVAPRVSSITAARLRVVMIVHIPACSRSQQLDAAANAVSSRTRPCSCHPLGCCSSLARCFSLLLLPLGHSPWTSGQERSEARGPPREGSTTTKTRKSSHRSFLMLYDFQAGMR